MVMLALAPLAATAQGVPASPVPGEAPTGVLAEFEIDELPTPHAEVWFLRMGLDPDGTAPLGRQAGPTVLYVESGQLTLETDGPVTLGAEAATGAAGPATPTGANETLLDAGASVLVSEGTSVSARNAAGEPATFLVLLMYPAEREGEDDGPSDEPVGFTQQGLSVGTAEFPPAPGTLTVERVVVALAGTMATDIQPPEGVWPGWMGIELGAVETGSAEVVFESRTLQNLTWPGMATGGRVEPEAVPLTATVRLAQGDGYAAFNSALSWTSTGDEPLTVLRAVVTPHKQ
jgi:hypothetical protein